MLIINNKSYMFKNIEIILNEMESIIEKENISREDDNQLQKLYYKAKKELKELKLFVSNDDNEYDFSEIIEKKINKYELIYNNLYLRFKGICSDFETPEDIIAVSMENMFPEGMDDSFDADDYLGID